ncbi:unnamed protein product, partial [Mycena citricolor]
FLSPSPSTANSLESWNTKAIGFYPQAEPEGYMGYQSVQMGQYPVAVPHGSQSRGQLDLQSPILYRRSTTASLRITINIRSQAQDILLLQALLMIHPTGSITDRIRAALTPHRRAAPTASSTVTSVTILRHHPPAQLVAAAADVPKTLTTTSWRSCIPRKIWLNRKEATRRQRIEAEQRRRDELRDGYAKLKDVLPLSNQKSSKVSLLDRATSHISLLEGENQALQDRVASLEQEIHRLQTLNEKLAGAGTSLEPASPGMYDGRPLSPLPRHRTHELIPPRALPMHPE